MSDEKPDLYTVLEHYGWNPPVERPGWWSTKCQVHGEQHASCRVNYDKQLLVCMACGFKGDVYTVIQHHEGVGFREAVSIGQDTFGASGPAVRGESRIRAGVPRRSGHTSGDSAYVPPRLRGRADARAG